jgi:hypothetical protein
MPQYRTHMTTQKFSTEHSISNCMLASRRAALEWETRSQSQVVSRVQHVISCALSRTACPQQVLHRHPVVCESCRTVRNNLMLYDVPNTQAFAVPAMHACHRPVVRLNHVI